jgi:ribosome maturation factor RimP
MNPQKLRQRVREIIEPSLQRMGFDLVAVELVAGRRATLRLSVDGPQGVGIGDLTRITHRVSPLLDEADPMPGSYDLEVSSPGIERPVQRMSDFVRFVGFRARVVLEEGLPRRRYTGRLVAAEGDTVTIEVDGVACELPFGQIEKAQLVLDLAEFERLGQLRWPGESPSEVSDDASEAAEPPADRGA